MPETTIATEVNPAANTSGAEEVEVATPEAIQTLTETPANSEEGEAAPAETPSEEKAKKNWAQRRIDELTRNWRETERDRDHWREIAVGKPAAPEAAKPAPSKPKPKYEDFQNDPDPFTALAEAMSDWKAEEKLKAFQSQQETKAKAEKEQADRQRAQADWNQKTAKAREAHSDWDEVTSNPDIPLSQGMTYVILNAEEGAEAAYFLGQNQEEAKRIAALSTQDPTGLATILEMGKLIGRLAVKQPAKPAQSRAPKPPNPVTKPSVTDNSLRDDLSPEEWLKRRYKQLEAQGRRV